MSDLFKKTRGMLSDKSFFTSLSMSWMALALVHYFPTEIPFVDRLPSITPIMILMALAVGTRHPDDRSKIAWSAALATVCTLILSCGFDLGVYPLLKSDVASLAVAGFVGLAAVMFSVITFFKLGQLLSIRLANGGHKEFFRALCLGSICGIVLFIFFTSTRMGPASLILTLLFFPGKPRLPIMVAALAVALLCQSTNSKFIFSPYKKFEVKTVRERTVVIAADGLPFNFCVEIPDAKGFQQFAKMAHVQSEIDTFRYYLGRLAMPLGLSRRKLDDVLILGAGTGNDVSFALKNGAENIDAVESDGRLIRTVTPRHPDKPYQDPKVKIHIEDPRIFLRSTKKKYDLIEFCYFNPGRSDSAPYAIKSDSFIYTTECFNLALQCLKADGVIFIGFTAPGNSLAPARLHASVLDTGEKAQIAYVQHDADTDPMATKYFFFALGPGIKRLSKSDLDPLVTQFIHVTSFENLPLDEKGGTDNWPFLRVHDRERLDTGLFALAVTVLAGLMAFFPKLSDRRFYLPPLLLGLNIAVANYLSLASLTLIAGFHWFTPALILILNLVCFFFSTWGGKSITERWSWLLYLGAAVACGLVLSGDQLTVLGSSQLLILTSTYMLAGMVERYSSPRMVVYWTLAGLAIGCVSAFVALYFGLGGLGIIGLISLVLSYAFEKTSEKIST